MKLFGKPLGAVILDVDGVILQLTEPFMECLETLARESDLPTQPVQEYFRAVADGHRHGFSNLLDEGIRSFWPSLTAGEVTRLAWRFQELKCLKPWPAIEGSVETVAWLKQHGLPIALCTTNDLPTLGRILKNVGLGLNMFVAASTWETGYHKPDPRCLEPIFDAVRVSREHAVYVGDWFPDAALARNAGVRFLAVLSGGIPRHAFLGEGVPDDHIIERLAMFPRLVQNSEPRSV